jgi:hypothetical protein
LYSLAQALQVDPTNPDLLAQQKELHIVQTEQKQEKAIQSVPIPLAMLAKVEALQGQLQSRQLSPRPDLNLNLSDIDHSVSLALVRTHLRQCGMLQELLDFIKYVQTASSCTSTTAGDEVDYVLLLSQALRLLAATIDSQRSSKLLFVECHLYPALKVMLVQSEFSISSLPLVTAVLEVLQVLSYDDHGCMKSKQLVLTDLQLVPALSSVMSNLSSHFIQSQQKGEQQQPFLTCLQHSLSIVRTLAAEAEDLLSSLDKAQSVRLVCAVGYVLQCILDSQQQGRKMEEQMLERCMEVLLLVSQRENMRAAFACALPLDGPAAVASHDRSSHHHRSTVSTLLRVQKALPHQLVNVLSVLMNASVVSVAGSNQQTQGHRLTVIDEIYAHGGLDIALAKYEGQEDLYSVQERVRRAGLLSRLVSLSSVQQRLLTISHYRSLCHHLHTLLFPSNIGVEEGVDKWLQEEKAIYVRILASLPLASHPDLARLLAAGREEHILTSLISIFPQPRTECQEITPTSVTLMPNAPVVAVLLGNAARCLMPYLDDPVGAKTLFGDRKHIAVEKLICSMASCTDIRVRKNIAILLAKACKSAPEVRERISHFRGLQMMIELQNEL